MKVNVSSSYFRAKSRPSIAVYGTKSTFRKESADKHEQHLKLFFLPEQPGFGVDQPSEYGVLAWYDDLSRYHEERVVSETGDYGRYYNALYRTLAPGFPALVKPEETVAQIKNSGKRVRRTFLTGESENDNLEFHFSYTTSYTTNAIELKTFVA